MKLRYNTKVNVPNLCHIQHKMHNGIYIFEVDEENIRDKRKTKNKKGGTIICYVIVCGLEFYLLS